MTEKKNPTILLLFVGRCVLSDGKSEGRLYYQLSEDDFKAGTIPMEDGEPIERVFSAKISKYLGGNPGIVYRVEVPADNQTQIFPSSARYVGRWEDQDQCAAWQMADQTKGQQISLMKEHGRAKRQDDVLECLAPIREAYQRARGMQRSLILARAVQYITRN
jgi:hypothetical protein